jgi:hypothetical protein
MTDNIPGLSCPACGSLVHWKNRASMTVACDNGHSKRVKYAGANSIAFRAKPGPRHGVRKSWRVNGKILPDVGAHLAAHGVGGQAIVDAGVLELLSKFPIANDDCV